MKFKRILWTLLLISAVCLSSVCSAATLKYGDKGNDVTEIQNYLIAQNLLHTSADGEYGPATVKAIKDFQTALGLKADGVCNAQTYKLLRAAAYDEIDITTYKPGDYVPEPPKNSSAKSVLTAVETATKVVQHAGIGDVIQLGTKGEGVVHLQKKLTELGFYTGKAHGTCDEATVNALKKFQASRNIKSDGICGRKTYSALEELPLNLNDYAFNSQPPDYSKVIRVEATAYSSAQPNLSKYTATGKLCKRGVIAVDPKIIPLGTKVFIPGYGYAVAEDTGSAIRGHKIDIAFDTVAECYQFGRKNIEIYIV